MSSKPESSSSSSSSPNMVPSKKPSRRRKGLWIAGGIAGGLIVMVLVIAAILPSMLSAGVLKDTLEGAADDAVQGQITWDDIDMGWGKGQTIHGLKILDAQGNLIVSAPKALAPDVSLWSLLWGGKNLGTITLVVDQAQLVQEQDGQLNLAKALTSTPSNKPRKPKDTTSDEPLGGWQAKVVLDGSDIHIQPLDAKPLTVTQLDVTADLMNPAQRISAEYAIRITRNDQPAGESSGQLNLTDAMDDHGDLQMGTAKVEADLRLTDVPTELLAAIIGQDQKLQAMLGPTLSAQVQLTGPLLSPNGNIKARSAQLRVDTGIVSTAEAITLTSGKALQLTVNQEGWSAWAGDTQATLQSPFDLSMVVNELVLPREGMSVRWQQAKVSLALEAGDIRLQGPGETGQLSLTGASLKVDSESLTQAIQLAMQATAARNQDVGQVRVEATVRDLINQAGQVSAGQMTAQVDGRISQLPVAVVDELLAMNGKLRAAVGPVLESRLTASISPEGGQAAAAGPFEWTFTSQNMNGRFSGRFSQDALAMDDRSGLKLTLPVADAVMLGLPADTLASPVVAELAIAQARIPRSEAGLLVHEGKLEATLTVQPMSLRNVGSYATVQLSDVAMRVNSEALGNTLQWTASALARAGDQEGRFNAQATVKNLVSAPDSEAQAMTVAYEVNANDLPVALLDGLAGQGGKLESWLGPRVTLQTQGQARQGETSWLDEGEVTLTASSANLTAKLEGDLQAGVLKTRPGSEVKYQAPVQMLAEQGLTLTQPLTVTLSPGRIAVPMSPWNLEAVAIDGLTVKTSPLIPSGELAKLGYQLSELEGKVTSPALGDRLSLSITGHARHNGAGDSPVSVEAMVRQPLSDSPVGEAKVTLKDVAMPIIDALAQQDGLLTAVLGTTLETLAVDIHTPTPAERAQVGAADDAQWWMLDAKLITSQLRMPSLKGQAAMGQAVVLRTAEPITLSLTPEAYRRLMTPAEVKSTAAATANEKEQGSSNPLKQVIGAILPKPDANNETKNAAAHEPYALATAMPIQLSLDELRLSLAPAEQGASEVGPFDLDRVTLKAQAAIGEMTLQRPNAGDRVVARDVKVNLATDPNLEASLKVQATGQTQAYASGSTAVGQPGNFNANLNVKQLAMLPQGGVDWFNAQTQMDIQLKAFPTPLADNLAGQEGRLVGLLGQTMDALIKGNVPGDLDTQLTTPQAKVNGQLHVTDQRVIHLRENLTAALSLTPEAVAVLGILNPQLLALESSENPVSLVVAKDGFALPLPQPGQPVDISAIRSNVTLELGQVKLRREGLVQDVFEVLSGFGGIFKSNQVMDVVFTPLVVSMRNGVVDTNDMWMVSTDLVMGTQGQIDFTREPAIASIYVGISGQMLRKLPGARSGLSPSHVSDIHIAAPLDQIKLDKGKLILQLTPLFATAYGGKDAGKVLEGIGQGIELLERLQGKKPVAQQDVPWPSQPLPPVEEEAVTNPQPITEPAAGDPPTTSDPASQPTGEPTGEPKDAQAQPAQEKEKERKKEKPIDVLRDLLR